MAFLTTLSRMNTEGVAARGLRARFSANAGDEAAGAMVLVEQLGHTVSRSQIRAADFWARGSISRPQSLTQLPVNHRAGIVLWARLAASSPPASVSAPSP
jgi:hypothetical protein